MTLLHTSKYRTDTIRLLFCAKLPRIQKALQMILDNLTPRESVEMTYWRDEVWYVEVIDLPMRRRLSGTQEVVSAIRFGLTIDVKRDKVLWNKDQGNCWVRGRRWDKIVAAGFQKEWNDNGQSLKHKRRTGDLDRKHIHIYGGARA